MAVDKEELKKDILAFVEKKSKFKPKMYLKDMYKANADAKPREIKNAANELVRDEKLEFWSSGSTTLFGLKGSSAKETATFEEKD